MRIATWEAKLTSLCLQIDLIFLILIVLHQLLLCSGKQASFPYIAMFYRTSQRSLYLRRMHINAENQILIRQVVRFYAIDATLIYFLLTLYTVYTLTKHCFSLLMTLKRITDN